MYDYALDFLLVVNVIGVLVMWEKGYYRTATEKHSCNGVLENIRYGFYK